MTINETKRYKKDIKNAARFSIEHLSRSKLCDEQRMKKIKWQKKSTRLSGVHPHKYAHASNEQIIVTFFSSSFTFFFIHIYKMNTTTNTALSSTTRLARSNSCLCFCCTHSFFLEQATISEKKTFACSFSLTLASTLFTNFHVLFVCDAVCVGIIWFLFLFFFSWMDWISTPAAKFSAQTDTVTQTRGDNNGQMKKITEFSVQTPPQLDCMHSRSFHFEMFAVSILWPESRWCVCVFEVKQWRPLRQNAYLCFVHTHKRNCSKTVST